VIAVFTVATALGAALLFLVEPMAAKALLPWLGGSAAVWMVSLVFFQTALLGGYLYAHLLASRLGPRRRIVAHAVVMATAALLVWWRGTVPAGPVHGPPSLWILGALTSSVGLPFLVLAASGPLLQSWLADLRDGRDPYRLYAVGNASSLVALLAYPLLVERTLPLAAFAGSAQAGQGLTQNGLWAGAFTLFVALVLACGIRAARRAPGAGPAIPAPHASRASARQRSSPGRRRSPAKGSEVRAPASSPVAPLSRWTRWAFLGFVPAAAMLGTTQALTTDVAAVPLLWVAPLAVYLLTFVVAFARPVQLPLRSVGWATAALVIAVAATQWLSLRPPLQLALPLYLTTLLAVGLLCHGRLARDRPPARDLTGYYLAIASGGALGSMFCGLLAPVLFRSIAEYPIALVLACLCRADAPAAPANRSRRLIVDLLLALGLAALVAALHAALAPRQSASPLSLQIEVAVACLACAALAWRPRAFAAGAAVLFVMVARTGPQTGFDILVTRTFFGVLRVKDAPGLPFSTEDGPDARPRQLPMHELYSGTTLHGTQLRTGDQLQRLPTTYYHPMGPLGRAIAGLRARPGRPRLAEVGVVGLGVGSLAAYAQPGERFTFFEVDAEVARIARDPALFSFLQDSQGINDVVLADGRIGLAAQPDARYDLIVMDAFSSDAVPVHLLTREALGILLSKLRPGGLVAYHLSSRYFDLGPVMAAGAAALGAPGLYWYDETPRPAGLAVGQAASCWVLVARDAADLEPVRPTGPWTPLSSQGRIPGTRWLWTDRYSSPLTALR
jgi:hypothetical protein